MKKDISVYLATDKDGNSIVSLVQGELSTDLANNTKNIESSPETKQALRELLETLLEKL